MKLVKILFLLFALAFSYPAMAQVGEDNAPSADNTVGKGECTQLRDAAKQLKGHADELVSTGGTVCPCAPKPGLWLERVVYCFANAPNGLIYGIVQDLISKLMPYYWTMMGPLILFSMVLFGWKLTTGAMHSLNKEVFTYGMKLGGVVTFLAFFPVLHALMLDMVQELSELAAEPFTQFADICNLGSNADKPTLWAQWDCIFGKLIGVSAADHNSKFVGSGLFMGIMGYLLAFLFIPGIGTGVIIAGIYVIFTLMAAAMRAVNTYLMAIMAISFMFLISPLFVPLVLFGASYQRFYTWLQILIGYILQPMMLIAFLGIMTVALEYSIFVGPTSLFGAFTNTNSSKADYFTNQLIAGTDNGKKVNLTKHFEPTTKVVGRYNMNPEITPAKPGFNESLKYNEAGNTGMFKGLPTTDPAHKGAGSVDMGINTPNVDVENYVQDLNQKDDAIETNLTSWDWIKRILLQLLTTAMLVYTLYTMLGAIPKITHDLVARKTGGNLATANILGLAAAQKAIAVAREALKIYIAAKTGNTKALAESAKKAYDNMVAKR